MMTRRRVAVASVTIAVLICLGGPARLSGLPGSDSLPVRLADQEFWKLSAESSEPDGWFRSDNLLSNEVGLQYVIPELIRTASSGAVYMGVGPEQNFTYIAALKPKMAFIVDVRRGNLQLHLLYKALFEMSADRATFVSRLFSRKRPDGLKSSSSAQEIFAAFAKVEGTEALYKENLKAVEDHLAKKHGFTLSPTDLEGINYVYHAFFWYGPDIQYWSTGGRFGRGFRATYADLMTATDMEGTPRSYLADEGRFATLKDLESRNLLVPVVGNFNGPKAIRAVGAWVRAHGAKISAFYLSNVEQYLSQEGTWNAFCGNVATLPLDDTSTFIRSVRTGYDGRGMGLTSELGNIDAEVKGCTAGSR